MHNQSIPLLLDPVRNTLLTSMKPLVLTLTGLVALQATGTVLAQNLDAAPLFGAVSLEAGFSSTPHTLEVSPGGEDEISSLGSDCYGYMRFAQPDFVLSYQAGSSPLGVFAVSDLDITMAINDPGGAWHCNDDSPFLSGTNSGIQFNSPLSGDYQIWVGSFESGAESRATMLAITEVDEAEWASVPIGLEESVYAASFDLNGDVVYGDDSSGYSNDGECDDPRFQGPSAAFSANLEHVFKDATDCRTQLEAGLVRLAEPQDMNLGGFVNTDLFGDDTDVLGGNISTASPITMPGSGPFGEVAFALMQAFQAIPGDRAGAVPLPFGLGGASASNYDRAAMLELTGVDFGDNSGLFADDGECDDARFEGSGAADFNIEGGEFVDAADCSSLYLEGLLTYIDPATVSSSAIVDSSGVNFGENNSVFADDGECDDPRFSGPGAALSASANNAMRDANDCRALFESGQVTLVTRTSDSSSASSAITNTQATPSTAAPRETYTIGTPRGDINGATLEDGSIYASGTVYGGPIDTADRLGNRIASPANPAPTLSRLFPNSSIDFGDDSSTWANDGECDDPRFEGSGMALSSIDEDLGRDAADCRTAFEAGTITLIPN